MVSVSIYCVGLVAMIVASAAYQLWRQFDPELARHMSLFYTGRLYAREVISQKQRELCAVAALTVRTVARRHQAYTWLLLIGILVMATGNPLFCSLWTLVGYPALNLPLLGNADGLPIGVQLVGAPGRDERLLRTAKAMLASLN